MEHLVRLGVGDAYEDLPAKVIAAVRWAKDAEYDYVYKVDTDATPVQVHHAKNAIDKGVDWMGSENKMYRAGRRHQQRVRVRTLAGLAFRRAAPDLNTNRTRANPVAWTAGTVSSQP